VKREEWKVLLEKHPHWRVAEVCEGRIFVHNTRTGRCYEIDPVGDITPEEAEEVLEGRREPVMLYTITRIVGYYSSTANWNRSKLGELEDRRKGNYALSPSEKPKRKDEQEVTV
jgi:hypothetical protein